MATYNSTQALGVAKAVEQGSQVAVGTISTTAAGSVGDVCNVVKLPRGAVIERIESVGACIGTLLTFSVGDDGSSTRHGTLSHTATAEFKTPTLTKAGFKYISLSDDANDWFLKFTTATATSVSAGWSITVQVTYHIDAFSA